MASPLLKILVAFNLFICVFGRSMPFYMDPRMRIFASCEQRGGLFWSREYRRLQDEIGGENGYLTVELDEKTTREITEKSREFIEKCYKEGLEQLEKEKGGKKDLGLGRPIIMI